MPEIDASPGNDYSLWTVWRRDPQHPVTTDDASELAAVVEELAGAGVTIRGFYDVSAMRADADLMIWLHGPVAEALQAATRRLRRTALLAPLVMSWSGMAVHRDSEFNKSHIPGYLRGESARDWLVVYPFVRSYDWYLLPDDERRKMLADHGRMGAAYKSVVANTMPAFALGDYEWMLPMESDSLTDLVDMMRDLRYTDARLHVRDELPFHTGRRIAVDEIAEVIR
ncbi:MAG: hydrogen peroxide-dependent heme synthase [Microbacterium gubbeenense]|uniref:hydrogen peroxide-dependent heme synthase n=1 Tax=Microbacterium gubbeenense TaxID=159896 RepID=UPI000410DF39|nr:hydrogen peroxide-dependent heme synthase [Microbacterium gubbeenense]